MYHIYLTIGQFLIFTIVPIAKALIEAQNDKVEKDKILMESNYTESIEHKQSGILRLILFGTVAFVVVSLAYWHIYSLTTFVAFIYQLAIFFTLFDARLNSLDKKSLYFIGNTATTDKLARKYIKDEYLYFQIKLIFLVLMTCLLPILLLQCK